MANNYKMEGYTTPRGVNDSRSVKEWQRKLGVTPDGIWGKNTQAAYDKYLANPVTLPKDDRGAQKRSLRVLNTMGKLGESKASYGASAVGAGAAKGAVGSYFANTVPTTNPGGYAAGLGLVKLPQAEVKQQSAVAEFIGNSSAKGLQKGYLPSSFPTREEIEEKNRQKYADTTPIDDRYFMNPRSAAEAWGAEHAPQSADRERGALIFEVNDNGKKAYTLGDTFTGEQNTVIDPLMREYGTWAKQYFLGGNDGESTGKMVGMVHSHPDPGSSYNDFPSEYDLLQYYLPYMDLVYIAPNTVTRQGVKSLINAASLSEWETTNPQRGMKNVAEEFFETYLPQDVGNIKNAYPVYSDKIFNRIEKGLLNTDNVYHNPIINAAKRSIDKNMTEKIIPAIPQILQRIMDYIDPIELGTLRGKKYQ